MWLLNKCPKVLKKSRYSCTHWTVHWYTENVASVATDQEISENLSESNVGQKQKCKECDFETSVPKYLKSHAIVAHTGQYSCQRGCKILVSDIVDDLGYLGACR